MYSIDGCILCKYNMGDIVSMKSNDKDNKKDKLNNNEDPKFKKQMEELNKRNVTQDILTLDDDMEDVYGAF